MTDVRSTTARIGSAVRGNSYEDRHRGEQVTTTIASSRKTGSGGKQASVSVSEGKKVETIADPSSHLSRLGQAFIKIGSGQYSTCKNFIVDYPDILHENLANFQLEAIRLERQGKLSMVRNCVQQLLLVRGCLSKSDNEYEYDPFLNRMEKKDPETLKGFLVDFDTTLQALRAKAAEGTLQPVKSVGSDTFQSTSRGLSGVPPKRHAPEMIRSDSDDTESSTPFKAMTIGSRHHLDQSGSHGQTGHKSMMPLPSRPATNRRPTLDSVHENFPLDVQSDTNSQAGDVSIADAELLDIRGSAGEREELDHRYQRRPNDAKNFFVVGRIFAMLWHEGAGDKKHGHLSQVGPYKVEKYDKKGFKYNEEVYSHIRRMAVVKARHGYCWCIPINTYSYQGVAKKGLSDVDRQAHAIIYMEDTKPGISPKEKGMMFKNPIAVTAADPTQKLHVMSRINFGKVYSVEWNVKVMPVGRVNAQSMPSFTGYWHNEANN